MARTLAVQDTLKSSGVVRVIAPNAKQRERAFYVTPIEDAVTRSFLTGSEVNDENKKGLSPDQIKRLEKVYLVAKQLFINDSESAKKENDGNPISEIIPIRHLQSFDRSKDQDVAYLNLLGVSGVVAKNKKSFNGTEHFYYLEDAELEAEELSNELDEKGQAFEMIKKVDPADYSSYIRYLLGTAPEGFSAAMKKKALLEFVDKNPKRCLQLLSLKDLGVRLTIHKMIEKRVITKDDFNNCYKKGESTIGYTFDDLVKYLTDEKNSQLFETWSKEASE